MPTESTGTSASDNVDSWLAACGRGDGAALQQIYRAMAAQLFGIALRIVRRRELAEDVLHEAFLQIWRRADRFDQTRGAARPWIIAIVRYRALDALRRAQREIPTETPVLDDVADLSPDALAAVTLNRDAEHLSRCLGELAAPAQKCVLLAYVEGYSQSEIAARLATPVGTVKSWIRRSLVALKQCLER